LHFQFPDEIENTKSLREGTTMEKNSKTDRLKPLEENYFADIIGTNLQYAVEAYLWETHVPMTEDGKIVSGFWDRRKGQALPEGYEMEGEGRFLTRAKTQRRKEKGRVIS